MSYHSVIPVLTDGVKIGTINIKMLRKWNPSSLQEDYVVSEWSFTEYDLRKSEKKIKKA